MIVSTTLSKIPCNQFKDKIEEVAKNNSWGGARGSGLTRGMIDSSNLDTISSKIEAIMNKKLFKFKLAQGSSNVSSATEKLFSYRIFEGTIHDASYCGGSNFEHVVPLDNEGCSQEGAPVMNYDCYNPECVTVGFGGQNQGYAHQGSYNNQPFRPPC